MKTRAIIVDIDGTIADISHRLHHIKDYADDENNRKKKDWNAFNADCHLDSPKEKILTIVNLYSTMGMAVLLVSGRNNNVREKTEDWLEKHEIDYDRLFMRPEGNYESDDVVKERILKEEILPKYDIEIVLDDRDRVVAMWRRNGLTCLQVQPGDY